LYYYGPPGTGKTTAIERTLSTVRKIYPVADFYCKLGGLSKFWDGYDNQPITWIDDPASPNAIRTGDEEPIQRLKTVISTGEILVEVKHGTMVFDSSLIVLSTNMNPEDLARACREDNREAMYQRFTDTAGAHYIGTKKSGRDRIIEHLLQVIKINIYHNLNIEIDIQKVVNSIPNLNLAN